MAERKKEKSAGRPAGTCKKRRFRETNLGRFIYLLEPLLYKVICPSEALNYAPEVFLIEMVISCSDNPSFKTERFNKYLEEYKEHGLHIQRVKPIKTESLEHYRSLRFTRALNYVRTHKRELQAKERLTMELIQMAVNKLEGR